MNTPNTIAAVIAGDNELLKINHYLDSKFGQDSIQALTVMSDLAELKKMLIEEIVHFVFEKTDGTTRDAYGTRAVDVIRRYDTGSSTQKPQRGYARDLRSVHLLYSRNGLHVHFRCDRHLGIQESACI